MGVPVSKAAAAERIRSLKLVPAAPVGLRTPAYPAAYLADVWAAPDGRQALHDAFTRDPDLLAVIAIASASLGHAAKRWLGDSFDADDGVAMSLYAYLARSSMRATPFAACAAVGIIDVSPAGLGLRCSELQIRARPDAEWLHSAGEALERDFAAFERLTLSPSGLVLEIGGRLEVADVARAELRPIGAFRSIVPIPTAFNATAAVTTLLTSCRPGMTVAELAALVAAKLGVGSRDVILLIAKLAAIGVFVTEGRPALGNRPADALARVYQRCMPEQAVTFDRFCSLLADAGAAPLRDVPALLAVASETAATIADTTHVAQVDAVRTYHGSLPVGLIERLGAAIEKLAEISPQTREPLLLAQGFRAKYNAGRYVPLLELLDPAEGLAFEALLAAPDAAWERIDATMSELVVEAVAGRVREIEIDANVYGKLIAARGERSPHFRVPSHLEAIATLRAGRDGDLDIALTGQVCEGRSTSLGRFGDILTVPHAVDDDRDGAIVAEFVGTPHLRRVGNIANQCIGTRYVFCCGASSGRDPEHTITPADVVVGYEGNRLVMRLKASGKQLRVVFSHRLNPGFASRLAAFVQYVSLSDLAIAGLPWGPVSGRLPFRPRLTIDGITVAPAQWRIPADVARDPAGSAGQAWRDRWMLPRTFEIAETDNRLPIDLESNIACAYLRKIAGRVPFLEATEMIPSFDDALIAGPRGRHVAEIAVTYAVSTAVATVQDIETTPVREHPFIPSDTLRAPGSEWIFAKLYMGAERMNYFLESEAAALFGFARDADDWHFLRYADPDPHVRIRFRVEDSACRASLIIELYAWFNALITAKSLRRVAIDTYDREVERYGGPMRIGNVEHLFTIDSTLVSQMLRTLRRVADADARLAADVTSFAIALCGSTENARALIRASLARRQKLGRESWALVRSAREFVDVDRYASIATLREAILSDLEPAAASSVANAILHMHCNRLGLTGETESHMRAIGAGICQGLIHGR